MRTIVVLNGKGGSGKSTISTNLAGYFANSGHLTVLKDCDPQGSSSAWLEQRSSARAKIYGIVANRTHIHSTRVWQHRIPPKTDYVIVDSPAGVDLNRILDSLRFANKILIPVIPSPIDIRASSLFIHELLKFMKIYRIKPEISVCVSRVTRKGPSYYALLRVFGNLGIKISGCINESENYIRAAELSTSIHEMSSPSCEKDKLDWRSIVDWITGDEPISLDKNNSDDKKVSESALA
ncbi:MAG: ParA family protein [Gammaproteobacteria bacterium]|nr:ParA family protein [Gammaproteobacteria bacterium]